MKLFPKLALMISTLLLSVTAGLSMSYYLTERRTIQQQADQERRAVLANLVHLSRESFLSSDDLLLVKYVGWLRRTNPSLLSASVVGPRGHVIAHSEPARIGTKERPLEPTRLEVIVLTEPVRLGTQWLATASVSFSEGYFREQVHARLRQLQKRVAQVAGAVLAAGLLMAFVMALSWSRTIGRLAHAAGRIGEGRFDFDLASTQRRQDELGLLARSFGQMADQLKELDRLKEDFVSAVTHELRSPLGAIESYLNLIQEDIRQGFDASSWPGYLERLRMNTRRLTRFVNDLLDVAALERGKMELLPQSVRLEKLAEDVLDFYAPQLLERKLSAFLYRPPDVPAAWADPDLLRQVLVNLISNAIKFTPELGRIEVGLETLEPRQTLRVSVKDTGVGIAEQDLQKIFNKFEQVRSARQTVRGPKGTGLGLAITRALVQLHGGTLGVTSRPGNGSTFFFEVPISRTSHIMEASHGQPGHLVR